MPVTVYIWEHSREHSWGHSSLQVEGGPYISWWPMGNRTYTIDKKKHKHLAGIMKKMVGTTQVFKAAHKTNNSLQADIFAEERHPAWEVRLAKGVLNEKKIALWWKGYNYENASYHSVKKNCTTTVIRALRAGGADNYVKGITFDFLSKRTGWEPTDLIEYLQNIAAKLGPEKVTFEKNQAFKVETEKWIQIYPPPEDSRLSLPPEPSGDPRSSVSSVPPGNPRLSLPPEPPGDPRLSLPEPPDFDASFDLMAEELFISPPGLRRSSSYVPPPPPGLRRSSSNAPGAGGQRLSLPPPPE